MDDNAKKIIAILDRRRKVCVLDSNNKNAIISDYVEKEGFFGRRKFKGYWMQVGYPINEKFRKIHPLPEMREKIKQPKKTDKGLYFEDIKDAIEWYGEEIKKEETLCHNPSCQGVRPDRVIFDEAVEYEEDQCKKCLGWLPHKTIPTSIKVTMCKCKISMDQDKKGSVKKEPTKLQFKTTYPLIAKKAVCISVDGGWDGDGWDWSDAIFSKDGTKVTIKDSLLLCNYSEHYLDIVNVWISKKWAKHFYGTHKVDEYGEKLIRIVKKGEREFLNESENKIYTQKEYDNMKEAWVYHLQKQVIHEGLNCMLDYIGNYLVIKKL